MSNVLISKNGKFTYQDESGKDVKIEDLNVHDGAGTIFSSVENIISLLLENAGADNFSKRFIGGQFKAAALTHTYLSYYKEEKEKFPGDDSRSQAVALTKTAVATISECVVGAKAGFIASKQLPIADPAIKALAVAAVTTASGALALFTVDKVNWSGEDSTVIDEAGNFMRDIWPKAKLDQEDRLLQPIYNPKSQITSCDSSTYVQNTYSFIDAFAVANQKHQHYGRFSEPIINNFLDGNYKSFYNIESNLMEPFTYYRARAKSFADVDIMQKLDIMKTQGFMSKYYSFSKEKYQFRDENKYYSQSTSSFDYRFTKMPNFKFDHSQSYKFKHHKYNPYHHHADGSWSGGYANGGRYARYDSKVGGWS